VVKQHTPADLENQALRYAEDFVNLAGEESFEVYSTRRQILRYNGWFGRVAEIGEVLGAAQRLVEKFPESERTDWTY
jgi:hypothetical protein